MSHLIPSSDVRVFGDHCSPIRYPHRYLYPAHVLNWGLRSIGKLFVATRTTGFTAAHDSQRRKNQPIRRVSGYQPTPTLSFKLLIESVSCQGGHVCVFLLANRIFLVLALQ